MVKYKKRFDEKYDCLRCGKIIESRNGFMPHSAWHRRKEVMQLNDDYDSGKTIQKHLDTY